MFLLFEEVPAAIWTDYGPVGIGIAGIVSVVAAFMKYLSNKDKDAKEISSGAIAALTQASVAISEVKNTLQESRHDLEEQTGILRNIHKGTDELLRSHADDNSVFATKPVLAKLEEQRVILSGLAADVKAIRLGEHKAG